MYMFTFQEHDLCWVTHQVCWFRVNRSVDRKSSYELCKFVKIIECNACNLDSLTAIMKDVWCSLPGGPSSRGSSCQKCSLPLGSLLFFKYRLAWHVCEYSRNLRNRTWAAEVGSSQHAGMCESKCDLILGCICYHILLWHFSCINILYVW